MSNVRGQLEARLLEEAAQQMLSDVIATMRLDSFQVIALLAAAGSFAKARADRMVAERETAQA